MSSSPSCTYSLMSMFSYSFSLPSGSSYCSSSPSHSFLFCSFFFSFSLTLSFFFFFFFLPLYFLSCFLHIPRPFLHRLPARDFLQAPLLFVRRDWLSVPVAISLAEFAVVTVFVIVSAVSFDSEPWFR